MNSVKTQKIKRETSTLPDFSVSLTLGDKTYSSTGTTLLGALNSLELPPKITTKGFLTVKGNNRTFERVMPLITLRRFLWPIARQIQAKILSVALGVK